MSDEIRVVRVPRACELLACSKPTLYRLLRRGAIKSFRDGGARKIELASLKAYIAAKLAADAWGKDPE